MTTLISQEPRIRMYHHPADLDRLAAREAQWKAERRKVRLQVWGIILAFLAVIVGGFALLFL